MWRREHFEDGGLFSQVVGRTAVDRDAGHRQHQAVRTFPRRRCFFAIVITEASISLTALARLARSVDAALSAAAAAAAAASLRIWVSCRFFHTTPDTGGGQHDGPRPRGEERASSGFSAQPVGLPTMSLRVRRSSRVIGLREASHRCPSQYRFPVRGRDTNRPGCRRFTCHFDHCPPHVLSGPTGPQSGGKRGLTGPAPLYIWNHTKACLYTPAGAGVTSERQQSHVAHPAIRHSSPNPDGPGQRRWKPVSSGGPAKGDYGYVSCALRGTP